MYRILFVCTGNTCRSPMAACLARAKVKQLGLDWDVESAGLYALPGLPMSEPAVAALARRGIEAADHAAKPVTPELVAGTDLILTMTSGHARELKERFPEAADKVHVLGVFVTSDDEPHSKPLDIADPFGGTDDDYERCAAALEAAIDRLVQKLQAEPAEASSDHRAAQADNQPGSDAAAHPAASPAAAEPASEAEGQPADGNGGETTH